MSALFSHTSCRGVFVSQHLSSADMLHARHKEFFERVALELGLPFTTLSVAHNETNSLAHAIAEIKAETTLERRPVLLLGGAYLDEFVSLLSLEALAEGYNVHLLVDISISRIPQFARVAEYRLFQAGAVPASLRQLLLQWRAITADSALSAILQKLIESYDLVSFQLNTTVAASTQERENP
jgi:hypothetical protein